jgi:hypothetical protein
MSIEFEFWSIYPDYLPLPNGEICFINVKFVFTECQLCFCLMSILP